MYTYFNNIVVRRVITGAANSFVLAVSLTLGSGDVMAETLKDVVEQRVNNIQTYVGNIDDLVKRETTDKGMEDPIINNPSLQEDYNESNPSRHKLELVESWPENLPYKPVPSREPLAVLADHDGNGTLESCVPFTDKNNSIILLSLQQARDYADMVKPILQAPKSNELLYAKYLQKYVVQAQGVEAQKIENEGLSFPGLPAPSIQPTFGAPALEKGPVDKTVERDEVDLADLELDQKWQDADGNIIETVRVVYDPKDGTQLRYGPGEGEHDQRFSINPKTKELVDTMAPGYVMPSETWPILQPVITDIKTGEVVDTKNLRRIYDKFNPGKNLPEPNVQPEIEKPVKDPSEMTFREAAIEAGIVEDKIPRGVFGALKQVENSRRPPKQNLEPTQDAPKVEAETSPLVEDKDIEPQLAIKADEEVSVAAAAARRAETFANALPPQRGDYEQSLKGALEFEKDLGARASNALDLIVAQDNPETKAEDKFSPEEVDGLVDRYQEVRPVYADILGDKSKHEQGLGAVRRQRGKDVMKEWKEEKEQAREETRKAQVVPDDPEDSVGGLVEEDEWNRALEEFQYLMIESQDLPQQKPFWDAVKEGLVELIADKQKLKTQDKEWGNSLEAAGPPPRGTDHKIVQQKALDMLEIIKEYREHKTEAGVRGRGETIDAKVQDWKDEHPKIGDALDKYNRHGEHTSVYNEALKTIGDLSIDNANDAEIEPQSAVEADKEMSVAAVSEPGLTGKPLVTAVCPLCETFKHAHDHTYELRVEPKAIEVKNEQVAAVDQTLPKLV